MTTPTDQGSLNVLIGCCTPSVLLGNADRDLGASLDDERSPIAVGLDPLERTLGFEHADGDPRFTILVPSTL